jgi:hypothetical protein
MDNATEAAMGRGETERGAAIRRISTRMEQGMSYCEALTTLAEEQGPGCAYARRVENLSTLAASRFRRACERAVTPRCLHVRPRTYTNCPTCRAAEERKS